MNLGFDCDTVKYVNMSNTIWQPRLARQDRPIYRAIANALERDLASGVLREGSRLPTHRELAERLRVTPLTITRAYREAARRGLIESSVGRGTFIRGGGLMPPDPALSSSGSLDLSKNVIAASDALDLDGRAVAALRPLVRETDYQPPAGSLRHRLAACAWAREVGFEVPPERVIITPGAQQAIVSILAAVSGAGDTVLVEELSYPRFGAIAALLHLEVRKIEVDEHGLVPASLEKALRATKARALYTIPNFQNPTASVMPEKRRREIAALARKHSLLVIEDDVYGFLLDTEPAPITHFAPETSCYVTSISKSLSPSMRFGFAVVPEALVDRVSSACGAINAFAPTTSAELFAFFQESGMARRTIENKRALIERNRRIATRVFGDALRNIHPMSPHLWVQLPVGADAQRITDRARQRGIEIGPASSFAPDGITSRNAVRISIGPTTDAVRLENALRTIASLIAEPRLGMTMVV